MHIRSATFAHPYSLTLACVLLACAVTGCSEGGEEDFTEANPFDLASGGDPDSGAFDEPALGGFGDGTTSDPDGSGSADGGGFATGPGLLPTIFNPFDGQAFHEAWLCDVSGEFGNTGQRIGYVFREDYNSSTGYRIGLDLVERTEVLNSNLEYVNWIETGPDSLSVVIAEYPEDIHSIVFRNADHWTGYSSIEQIGQMSCTRSPFDERDWIGDYD